MASIVTRGSCRAIQFLAPGGKRKTISLGRMPKHSAESVRVRIETLLVTKTAGLAIDGETARWLATIGDALAAKLAELGLIAPRVPREAVTLAAFIDGYIERRTDVSLGTRIHMRTARRRLTKFFGEDHPLDSITPALAADCAAWLKSKHALATAGRTIRLAQQYLAYAVDAGLIDRNPFSRIRAPGETNRKRLFEVTHAMTAAVIDACPSAEWRLIVALSRWGGLRCPSEHLALTWDDLDWAGDRFLVRSAKKRDERWVPLFQELRPHLEELHELAAPGTIYVITKSRDPGVNWRTTFTKIIRRAGLKPWPRLFHNLRSSRQTELAAVWPLADVCAWLGNSPVVAAGHYLKPSDSTFKAAARCIGAAPYSRGDAHTDAEAYLDESEKPIPTAILRVRALACASGPDSALGGTGFEPVTSTV